MPKTVNKQHIPGALKKRRHWVLWKNIHRGGQVAKIPYRVNGMEAKSNDPLTWDTFDAVWAQYLAVATTASVTSFQKMIHSSASTWTVAGTRATAKLTLRRSDRPLRFLRRSLAKRDRRQDHRGRQVAISTVGRKGVSHSLAVKAAGMRELKFTTTDVISP